MILPVVSSSMLVLSQVLQWRNWRTYYTFAQPDAYPSNISRLVPLSGSLGCLLNLSLAVAPAFRLDPPDRCTDQERRDGKGLCIAAPNISQPNEPLRF